MARSSTRRTTPTARRPRTTATCRGIPTCGPLATNNLVSAHDAALKLGSESEAATFWNTCFEHNYVFDSGCAMSLVGRDGATYESVTHRAIEVGLHVDHLIEQVIGVRDPAAALGVIRHLTFDWRQRALVHQATEQLDVHAQFRPRPTRLRHGGVRLRRSRRGASGRGPEGQRHRRQRAAPPRRSHCAPRSQRDGQIYVRDVIFRNHWKADTAREDVRSGRGAFTHGSPVQV